MDSIATEAGSGASGFDSGEIPRYMRLASAVSVPILAAIFVWRAPLFLDHLDDLLWWTVAVLIGDLLLVRTGDTVILSMSLPMALAAAMVLSPPEAALVAFVGCISPGELRGDVPLHRMLFNRGQVSTAVLAAALVFRLDSVAPTDVPEVVAWSLLALLTDFAVNAAFMLPLVLGGRRAPIKAAVAGLFGSRPIDTLMLYAAMGMLAPSVAMLYSSAGPAALVVALVPAVLAHVSLARSQHVGSLEARLEAKDVAIRRVSEQMTKERAEERALLANEIHDQVIPVLLKMHLMGQVVARDLREGRLFQLESDVSELLVIADEAQALTQAFAGGLRSSPIGSQGLVSALRLLADELQIVGGPRIELSLEPPVGTHSAQLLIFYVVREALRNACQHARSAEIAVQLMNEGGMLRAVVRDDGIGFEPIRAAANGHFGLKAMREMIGAAGGSLIVDSGLGAGTAVVVAVPPDA